MIKETTLQPPFAEMSLVTTRICMTKDLGINGNLFGGNMLSWLDEAGAALAAQICDTPNLVTVKIDEVFFERPVRVGQVIKIYGRIEFIGNSSIRLLVEARKHNVRTGMQKTVCTTRITFVSVDEEGDSQALSEKVRHRYRMFAGDRIAEPA